MLSGGKASKAPYCTWKPANSCPFCAPERVTKPRGASGTFSDREGSKPMFRRGMGQTSGSNGKLSGRSEEVWRCRERDEVEVGVGRELAERGCCDEGEDSDTKDIVYKKKWETSSGT